MHRLIEDASVDEADGDDLGALGEAGFEAEDGFLEVLLVLRWGVAGDGIMGAHIIANHGHEQEHGLLRKGCDKIVSAENVAKFLEVTRASTVDTYVLIVVVVAQVVLSHPHVDGVDWAINIGGELLGASVAGGP
jgi:hypothetical protein